MTEVIEALLYVFKTLMDHSEKCSKLSKENKFQSKLSFAVECRLHLPTLQPRTFITFVQHLISNFTSMFMNQLPRQKKKCGSFLKRMVSHFSKKITQTIKIKVHEIVAH